MNVIAVLSGFVPLFVNVFIVGGTLFHVHVAIAQFPVNHCASLILYENTVTHHSFIVLTNVIADEITLPQHAFHVYHAYHVLVVQPGSVPFAVNVIFAHSFALKFKLFAVGATLFHIHTHHVHILPLHCPSLILTYLHVFHGSVIVTVVLIAVCHATIAVHVEFVYHCCVTEAPVSIQLHVHVID